MHSKSPYEDALNLTTTNHVMSLADKNLIWKSPIYKFVIQGDLDDNDEQIYKEITIDVTDSVPTQDSPGIVLGSVIDQVLHEVPKKALILDFGAGKLRNTLHLLKKGYSVCAVEFEKTSQATDIATTIYEKAASYGNKFHRLVFPHEFLRTELKFDLALLINVCSIMPVPSERLLVLQYIRTKLKDRGRVLWYTIHRDQSMIQRCRPDQQIGDGFYMNASRRYQTFYRDFEMYEIDALFLANGYVYERKFDASKNYARLYRKVGLNPTECGKYSQICERRCPSRRA